MALTQEGRQLKLVTPLGADFLLIQGMNATEKLSELFRCELDLRHEETVAGDKPTAVDPKAILGKKVAIKIEQRDQTIRFWHGIVVNFAQGQRDERFSYYRATVVPQVWLLTQNVQSQIFQQISVPDILKKMLGGFDAAFEIQGEFKPRNYSVQYRESDWDFLSRLMEEEGIYYYFEHSETAHKLIVANTPQSHGDCASKSEIEFAAELAPTDDFKSSVGTWYVENNLRTGKYTLWDFNFGQPKKNLEAVQPSRFKVAGNDNLEFYDFPGGFAKRFDGVDKSGGEQPNELNNLFDDNKRTVGIRMEEIDVQYKQINGASDCASFAAGHRFKLKNHPNSENNIQHVLISVAHEVKQSPAYVTDEVDPNSYRNEFLCIPHGAGHAPFRPARKTPKPVVKGGQTAFVAGAPGEEIFTDKYGRVKVQFQWDRDSQADGKSSCWIRVAQAWAGNLWGTMFIPRVGMEVVVDFLEGDPDQPIITGCVYNAEAMPPYKLPDEKTKTTIKSDSTIGGGGFNEFRFEDKKGSEQIFVHAQKDVDVRVRNDRREWTGNDEHQIVKRDRREQIERDSHAIVKRDKAEKIERDLHLKIEGKDATEIGGSLSLKVGGAVAEKFGANHSEDTSGDIYLKAGANIVLEAGAAITLKVGGNFVTINSSGIFIKGTMVMINSGGAALSGSAGSLVAPMKPQIADPADDNKPGSKITLEKRSKARQERTFNPNASGGAGGAGGANGANDANAANDPNKDKTHWIKIKLVDEAGKPVPGEQYKITLPDNSVASGTLDEKGEAEVKGIDAGNCKVTFPNLDKDAWE